MAGLYPDNQILSFFGQEIEWPGVDSETGKFTNGSFTDPLKKPSFIPAETINLLLDNITNLLLYLGFDPNNTDPEQLRKAFHNNRPIGELRFLGFEPTPLQLATLRYLPLAGQIISVTDYSRLAANVYCGDANNSLWYQKQSDGTFVAKTSGTPNTANGDYWAAPAFYKCDASENRSTSGAYLKLPDARGVFLRGTGSQTLPNVSPLSGTTTYNGGAAGQLIMDAIRDISGDIAPIIGGGNNTFLTVAGAAGAFSSISSTGNGAILQYNGFTQGNIGIRFRASAVVPVAGENRPVSISAWVGITY
jgi:hypothetical protein